jgi:hypothetical protein
MIFRRVFWMVVKPRPKSLFKNRKEEEGIPTGTGAYCGHERSHTNTTGPSGRGCRAQAHGTRVLARTENGNATEATKGGFGLDGCSRRWLYAPGRVSPARQGGVERRGGREDAKDGTVGTVRAVGMSVYSSEKLGFGFSYPSSFVVAFDRTESYAPRSIPTGEDVALASVGSYSKSFVTVTVFGKRVRDDTDPSRPSSGKDFFYERVIQPVVDSPTTIGFSLTNESAAGDGDDGHYDFEFEHSVCRGETIEGKAGALRCIGNFGQDLPVQSRCV